MGPGFIHAYSTTQQVNISRLDSTTEINEAPPQRLLQIQGPALGKSPSLRGGLNPQGPAPPTGRHKARRVFPQLGHGVMLEARRNRGFCPDNR